MAIKVANNQSLTAITALPSAVSGGAMTLLETQTASSSSTISFTSNIDDTYDEYVFKFYDIHPETNAKSLMVNFSDDTSSHSYDLTKTTTEFYAYHLESGSASALSYITGSDLAQSTAAQEIIREIGNGNDDSGAGTLHLFSPSSSVFVKHFISRASVTQPSLGEDVNVAGYINTTAAVTAVQFSMNSGNIDSGVIKLYGIS